MFFMRLRIRLSCRINFSAEETSFVFLGREITIHSQDNDTPSNESLWLILRASAFETEDAARAFGKKLEAFLLVFGATNALSFDVGNDKSTAQFSAEVIAAMEAIQPNSKVSMNIHGLSVHSEEHTWSFVGFSATATTQFDPKMLVSLSASQPDNLPDLDSLIGESLRLINLAKIVNSNFAKIVLAFAAVERLGQADNWSAEEKTLLSAAAEAVRSSKIGEERDRQRVIKAIEKNSYPRSLREGVMKILESINRNDLKKRWEMKYDLRSNIFHGKSLRRDAELGTEANEIIDLCAEIILDAASADRALGSI